MRHRTHPCFSDRLDRLAHADGIDFRRSGKRANHDGHVVPPPLGIANVREQERPPLVLRDAAEELPAHQRVQLGVLVDGPVDAQEKTACCKISKMLLEVETRAAMLSRCALSETCRLQTCGLQTRGLQTRGLQTCRLIKHGFRLAPGLRRTLSLCKRHGIGCSRGRCSSN